MAKSKKQEYYLGRLFDDKKKKISDTPFYLDAENLTTHAIVTGMTGSGKTGLCITLLEEAALHGVPAIIIDPKGDLTNLLLHFPELAPEDFKPWLDADTARREGKDLSQLAVETADKWEEGLASWELGQEQLVSLRDSAQFTIFTPGSSAGEKVNILASFEAPEVPWQKNSEVLREKISSSVTALLSLVGVKDIDPLRSREHILISNIIENAWSAGESLSLSEIILRIQTPPFDKLGAFSMENFFPEEDRMDLALVLNNFLASPSFQAWLEGQSLEIGSMLYTPDGKPRHNIFYLAHLSENERMFFVTLLFAAVEAWMRTQSGTSNLRALVYFDEILGYLPPTHNPPSRPILLRMLKQARAFGVGLLLATQNPVDVDYKALSNAGTWIIGRLQTEQDKARLLDGLSSVQGSVDLKAIGELIAGLQKRVFLFHSVYHSEPLTFHTRWALNYLAGPLTRVQVQELVKQQIASDKPQTGQKVEIKKDAIPDAQSDNNGLPQFSSTRAAVPGDFSEVFIPTSISLNNALEKASIVSEGLQSERLLYRPALLAQADVYYYSRTHKVEYNSRQAVLLRNLRGNLIKWSEHIWSSYSFDDFEQEANQKALFAGLPTWLTNEQQLISWKKEYPEWIYRNAILKIHANEHLKIYASPEVSDDDFLRMCNDAAQQAIDEEIKKNEVSVNKKLKTLSQKIARQRGEVDEQQEELNMRRVEEMGTHGELLISLLSKRRRSISSSLTKRRMTEKAKLELEQEQEELEMLEAELKEIETSKTAAVEEITQRWQELVRDVTTVPLTPYKKDIKVNFFGVAWLPYYLVSAKGEEHELPAFSGQA